MDEATRERIIEATYLAVQQHGMDGLRVQHIGAMAGLSPGAMYRYFGSKEELLKACSEALDRRVFRIFEDMRPDPRLIRENPTEALRRLWVPYFRFWIANPSETVFCHRFRDSALFREYIEERDSEYFNYGKLLFQSFAEVYPGLKEVNYDLIWIHLLTGTIAYAKCVVVGMLPNSEETEKRIFGLLTTGLQSCL